MIRTVCGDIDSSELGVTMCHEHLILDLRPVRMDQDSYILDVDEVCNELMSMKQLGVDSIVELTTIDMARDVKKLRDISVRTGLHVICSTGFYLKEYHSDWLKRATIDEIRKLFVEELRNGIDDTDIRAGIIGEIASGSQEISETEMKVFKAAALAGQEVGCAISTHCNEGQQGLEQLAIFREHQVRPDQIILGHMDLCLDVEYHKQLLGQGVNLGFDTISKTKYNTDEDRAKQLVKLIELGYEDHLLLSQDVSRRTYFKALGQHGYDCVMGYFIDLLRAKGATEVQIHKMLVSNPARILDF